MLSSLPELFVESDELFFKELSSKLQEVNFTVKRHLVNVVTTSNRFLHRLSEFLPIVAIICIKTLVDVIWFDP
jgi:hypothetical protein